MSYHKLFYRYIFKNQKGFLPTFPPGRQIKLGDIVVLKNHRMEYLGNIGAQGLNINIVPDIDNSPSDSQWRAEEGVNITASLKGEAKPDISIPVNKAGITIEFTREGGFLFEPKGIRYNRIKNLIEVRQEVKRKLSRMLVGGSKSVYIVKEVAEVQSYALFISQSSNAEFSAYIDADIAVSSASLADGDLDFTVSKSKNMGISDISKEGGSIFFYGEKIKLKSEPLMELADAMPDLKTVDNPELMFALNKSDNDLEDSVEFEDLSLEDVEELVGNQEA